MTDGIDPHAPRSGRVFVLLVLCCALLVVVFTSLGVWQVQRLSWKRDLIARTDAMLVADPVTAPAPQAWPSLTQTGDEYRRVRVTGRYLTDDDTLVQAVTERGPGFWVMTPLVTDDGWSVMINRGFVPGERRAPADRVQPQGAQTVTGLLRLSQPDGAFLRSNDPVSDRWYSRDTAAIGLARDVGTVAPYFIDVSGDRNAQTLPVPGLTVLSFRNSHLSYALTWFAMALGLGCAVVWLLFIELRRVG